MSQVIRIPRSLYERLGAHAKGFETPASVIERLLNYYEDKKGCKNTVVVEEDSECPHSLDIVYYPPGEENFKREFLKSRRAYVLLHKMDGTSELKEWNARNFLPHSSVSGNLRSGYLRGWKNRGIYKAEVSIDKDSFE